MVKFYKGVAGRRGSAPVGIVIHNDSGSRYGTAAFYRQWLPTHDAELGFAHYYVAEDGTYQAEDEANMAWHTANWNGNSNYIGIEVCQSMGDEAVFRNNEQKVFKLAAEICKRYGWNPAYAIFPLHKEFSATSCPHRSWDLHGSSVQAVRQYYADQVKKYMGSSSTENNQNTNTKKGVATMFKLFKVKGKSTVYFYNGVSVVALSHPDQVKIIQSIYKQNNGQSLDIEEYTTNIPWYARLIQVTNAKKMDPGTPLFG